MTSASRSKGEDVARIARKLTPAQRELLSLGGACVKAYRPGQRLVELGLWQASDDEFAIFPHYTELGLAVRARLTDQEGQNR